MHLTFLFDHDILRHQPLGPSYISSVLKENGHQVSAINIDDGGIVEKIKELNPQVIAFSVTSGQILRFLQVCREIKKVHSCLSLFGGSHPTFFPDLIEEDGVDIICLGEGEYPVLELANCLDANQDYTHILNLAFNTGEKIIYNSTRPFISSEGLDDLPFPDRELIRSFPVWNERTGYVATGRGCPYDCSFCFNHVSKNIQEGKWTRSRSVDNVIQEIRWLKTDCKVVLIHFQDDTFILNRQWIMEFLPRYRDEIGLPFVCNVRADLTDEEMVQMLAGAGCCRVAMGIESGNDDIRSRVLAKRISSDQIKNACDLYNLYGIKIMGQNIFGVPGETIQTALETVTLNIRCKTHIGMYSFFTPYPGTQLAESAANEMNFTLDIQDIPYGYYDHLPACIQLPGRDIIEKIGQCAQLFTSYPRIFSISKFLLRIIPTAALKWMYLHWLYQIKKELYKKAEIGLPTIWHPPRVVREAGLHIPDIPVQPVVRARKGIKAQKKGSM